jgi:hypothetical protein
MILGALACQSNASGSLQIAAIAKTVTSNRIFQVTPMNVAEALQDIVRVQSKGPGKHLYTFSGSNAAQGVAWAQVEFQPGVKGRGWTLLQIRLGLASSDTKGAKTYPALLHAITARVGQPAWSDSDASENGPVGLPATTTRSSCRKDCLRIHWEKEVLRNLSSLI